MFSAVLLTISVAALGQFAVYYWRAVVAGVAVQPVSQHVMEAAHVDEKAMSGDDYRSLAELHRLTPNLAAKSAGLGMVPVYYKFSQLVQAVASGRAKALAAWAEREQVLCARYAAVQVDRRLQANLALAASIRSC
jgi:hypothetical protein